MTLGSSVILAVFVMFSPLFAGCTSVAELHPEHPARIRVGDQVAMRVDSNRHYAVNSAGSSLTLTKQTEERETTIYVYRAAEPGNQTFVLTPRDPGPDSCISCVTVHYFITVVR